MPHRFRIIVMALLSLLTCVAAYARPLAPYPTATLTVGGSEVAANTGSITIDFNGYLETVTYGQYSTPASLASALAAMFCRDYMAFGLYAKAQANGTPAYVITFQLVNGQDFAPINIVNGSSFTFIPSGFASSTATVADTGTATLNVNGVAITTGYGDGSNGQSIAEGLQDEANRIQALNPNALPVVVTAQGNNLYIQSKQTTGSFNYNYNLSFSTSLSFSSSPSSGTLTNTTNAAPVPVYSYTVGYDGTGNVTSLSDSVMGSWSYANGYDGLNRLVAGSASSGPYAGQYLCWSYDNFGNRTSQSVSTTPCGSSPPTTFAATYSANNQISTVSSPAGLSIGYEPSGSGNIINDGYNTYLYDGENRICAVNGPEGMVGYQYDADGNRIGKGTITTMSCDLTQNGYQPTSDYVLDLNGEQLTEVAIAGGVPGWQHTNVTADGMLITTYDNAGLHFYLNDPLGTRRAQTDQAGFPEQTCQSLPFGDQLYCTGSLTSPTEHHFTGKERDTESGLDYFGARYYASNMGRWMSPDWATKAEPVPYAKLDNPQSLNLYGYVLNNPLSKADPDGHCDWCQKVVNKLSGNGWKTDEQVAQKGVNRDIVLVPTKVGPGDMKGVTKVTWTPTKIENGKLQGPVSSDPKDPKVKVTLWESNSGGSYEHQGTTNGHADDSILTGSGMLSPPVDQHWSVNGERVQVVLGTDPATGAPKLAWQDHIDRSGAAPVYTPVAANPEP